MASETGISLREATEKAVEFLRQWYSFPQPLTTNKVGNEWIVEVDVGVTRTRIARVSISERSGEVAKYTVDERAS
jgi:hypothetical protein